jgi:hypothetical protein
VDDSLTAGSNESDINVFIDQLHHNFNIMMGALSNFLGMQIEQCQDGIFMCQHIYMGEVLERFKMHEANPVATHCDHSNGGTEDSVGRHMPYCEIVGCLRYLMTGTCPDIAIAELHAAQAMDQPTEAEWNDVKLILQVFVKNKQVCCLELVTMREC